MPRRTKLVVALVVLSIFTGGIIYGRAVQSPASQAQVSARPGSLRSEVGVGQSADHRPQAPWNLLGSYNPPMSEYGAAEMTGTTASDKDLLAFLKSPPEWATAQSVFVRSTTAIPPAAGSGAIAVMSSIRYFDNRLPGTGSYLIVTYVEPEDTYWNRPIMDKPIETRSDGVRIYMHRVNTSETGTPESFGALVKPNGYIITVTGNEALDVIAGYLNRLIVHGER